MKYVKKPVVIEAEQFTEKTKNRVYSWATEIQNNVYASRHENQPVLMIPTLEGEMMCRLGDWLIKGIRGELYPCKPDIFTETYERYSGE
jgi:hypothetical protein